MSKYTSDEILIHLAQNTINKYIKHNVDNESIEYIDMLNDFSSLSKKEN